jgi:hypothetical protein
MHDELLGGAKEAVKMAAVFGCTKNCNGFNPLMAGCT